jgi:hypothetical protein
MNEFNNPMKTRWLVAFALLAAGCSARHEKAALNADQARIMAVQLANDKAAELYRCRPFQDTATVRFDAGHWVWTERRAAGHSDFQATVELAANGSTNRVDIQLLDSQTLAHGF